MKEFFKRLFKPQTKGLNIQLSDLTLIADIISSRQFERVAAVMVLLILRAIKAGTLVLRPEQYVKLRSKVVESLQVGLEQVQRHAAGKDYDPVAIAALESWAQGKATPANFIDVYRAIAIPADDTVDDTVDESTV